MSTHVRSSILPISMWFKCLCDKDAMKAFHSRAVCNIRILLIIFYMDCRSYLFDKYTEPNIYRNSLMARLLYEYVV